MSDWIDRRRSRPESRPGGRCGRRRRSPSARAPAQQLGGIEEHAVRDRERGSRLRRRESLAQRVLEQEADDPGRDRADDERPAELRIHVAGGDAAVAERAPDPFEIRTQSRQKKPSNTSAVARCVRTRNERK